MRKSLIIAAFAATALIPLSALQAQVVPGVVSTATVPLSAINATVAYTGVAPSGSNGVATITLECKNAGTTNGSYTTQAFSGPSGGTLALGVPLVAAVLLPLPGIPGTSCRVVTVPPLNASAAIQIGGTNRAVTAGATEYIPVFGPTTINITFRYPSLTVKKVVTGTEPANSTYTVNVVCSTNGVFTPPALVLALKGGDSRTITTNDISNLSPDSLCDATEVNGFGSITTYTSTDASAVTAPVAVSTKSVLTKMGETITVANQFALIFQTAVGPPTTVAVTVAPTTAAPTTAAPTTTVAPTTTTAAPVPVAVVTTTVATAAPVVAAVPAEAVLATPTFAG
jgi:hypothetical protein